MSMVAGIKKKSSMNGVLEKPGRFGGRYDETNPQSENNKWPNGLKN
jgi:hypothetical protein